MVIATFESLILIFTISQNSSVSLLRSDFVVESFWIGPRWAEARCPGRRPVGQRRDSDVTYARRDSGLAAFPSALVAAAPTATLPRAPDRPQPLLPMRPGEAERPAHD